MMPGETHSKAAGTAADASGCQGCSALQQNLNEYVAALITLKQKIIDTDNLLTEYQKKCDELQFAERENSALRKQVEQMLQKISPLEKCQEELGCLKAELEEKKSSLKIYQDSSHEYTRVKEECLKSDARKKKLEAKVKKLEEAAVKHTEDLKQLKIEKKTLEKELKKTQEKLDEFPKQNTKKVLKHMGTQSSSNEPVETIDKRKIKLLLKELWLCIDSTEERLQNEDSEDIQASINEYSEIIENKSMEYKEEKTAKENIKSRKSVEECELLPQVQSNHLGPPEMKPCLTSFSVQLEQEFLGGCRSAEEDGPITVNVQDCSNDSAFHEDRNPEVFIPTSGEDDSSDSSDQEDPEDKPLMKDLEAIFDLFRLPPPLLSPVSTPPPTPLRYQVPSSSPLAPEDYFGDFTDSSEEELVGSEHSMPSLLENGTTPSQNTFNSSRGKEESSKLIEQPEQDLEIQDPVNLEMDEETAIGCDILTAELKFKDSKPNSKEEEMHISDTGPSSYKEHLVVSCESTEDENKYVLDKGVIPQDNEERDEAPLESKGPSFRIYCIPTETECLQKIPDDLVQVTEDVVLNEEICNSLLSQEKLVVPVASEEENTLSGTEPHKSEFTTQTSVGGLTSENEKLLLVSEHFQEIAGELPGKEEEEIQGLNIQKISESKQDVPIMVDTSELDIKTDFVSSSPSVTSSNCSNPQFSFDLGYNEVSWKFNGQCTLIEVVSTDFLNDTVPNQLHCMEQQSYETVQNKISDVVNKPPEPTDHSTGEYVVEKNINALSPNSATPLLTDQISRETECSDVSKVMTNIYIVDQGAFAKDVGDEQRKTKEPGIELNTTKSEDIILAASQSDLVKRVLDLDLSASCHNIVADMVIERECEGSPEAKLKYEQEDNKQLQTEMPVLENMASAKLGCHRENVNPGFKVVPVSDNQVSVIPEQLKSEEPQITNLEDLESHVEERTLAPDNTYTETEQHMPSKAKCIEEKKCHLQKIKQIETVNSPSAEDSPSWVTSELKSFSESLSVENSHYDPTRKLSAKSGEIALQNQKNVSEVDKKQDLQNQDHLKTMNAKEEFTPCIDVSLPDGLATEEICSRDASVSDVETLIIPLDAVSLSIQQIQKERTPGSTCLKSYMKEGSAFSSSLSKKDENETHVNLNILNDFVRCYIDSQEETEQDSEEEKDNQISYDSKSKNEAETNSEIKEQNFNKETQTQIGKTNTSKDAHAHIKKSRSLEIEYLTSALKDFNISAVSETNGFSTSGIFKFLENSQSQDYASGNSVLGCFDKVVTNKQMEKELKLGKIFEENLRKHSWVKTNEVSRETDDSEEDYPLRKVKCASRFTHCSLEEATKTYTKDVVPGMQNNCEDAHTKYTHISTILNTCNSIVAGHLKEKPLFCEITKSSSDIKQSLILDFDPERKSCTDRFVKENTQRREHKEYSDAGEGRSDSKDTIQMRTETVGKTTIEQNTSNSEGAMLLHHISRMNSEIVNGCGKDGNLSLSIKESEDWKIVKDKNLKSGMDQILSHELPEEVPAVQTILSEDVLENALDPVASAEYSPNTEQEQNGLPSNECHDDWPSSRQKDSSNSGQNGIFDKDTLWNPSMCDISFNSQGNNQISESPNISFDSTHDTLELEPFVDLVKQSKSGSETLNQKPSHNLTKAFAKSKIEVSHGKASRKSSRVKSKTKTQQSHLDQPVLATADTSTPTKCSPDTLSKIRQEMGPPLPPLLAPLLATPPRTLHPVSPLMSTSSQSSLTSPLDDLISPLRDTPVPPLMSPLSDDPRYKSPMHSTPSPSDAPASQRILSSPLQFCAATPKHALPVPGRLPPLAVGNNALGGPQENSVKILDTMYPELSARARTLNILKGNIQLNRCPPADCKNLPGPVNNITGFKAITSTSTAFVKTGSSSTIECDQGKLKDSGTELMSFQSHNGKRPLVPSTILRSAKRLRLDSESPKLEIKVDVSEIKMPQTSSPQVENEITHDDENSSVQEPADNSITESSSALEEYKGPHDKDMISVLKKIAESSFDLLPVIRSHVHVGNVSKKPVMRDEEKEVVCEFSTTKKHLAQPLLHAILSELKIHKTSLDHTYVHALCRVYVGICRQLGDLERARLFCYDLLKEDFPESDKLTLFIANIWHDIFAFQGVINKAMQLVVRQRAKGEVLNCLIMYLNWEKTSSLDVSMMISQLLLTIQLCPKMEFHLSEKFGEDLNDDLWEYIFAIDLLCSHQKWVWTHDNIISKELWPIMDKWIKHRKGHLNIEYTPDIIVALILRLIGRLGQLGLKEGFSSAVKNISSVICMFIQHSNEEDVPWSIQLAAVYALCDLSPSNPAEVSKVLENWTRVTTKSIPSAVMSCLAEVSLLCAAELS